MPLKPSKVKNPFLMKKLQENYKDITEFYQQSGITTGWETVRRLIHEGEEVSPVSPASVILIMHYLKFTPSEIKEEMQKRGKKNPVAAVLAELIGECNVPLIALEEWKNILLEKIEKIKKQSPSGFAQVTSLIDTIIKAEGIDVAKQTKRKGRKRG